MNSGNILVGVSILLFIAGIVLLSIGENKDKESLKYSGSGTFAAGAILLLFTLLVVKKDI